MSQINSFFVIIYFVEKSLSEDLILRFLTVQIILFSEPNFDILPLIIHLNNRFSFFLIIYTYIKKLKNSVTTRRFFLFSRFLSLTLVPYITPTQFRTSREHLHYPTAEKEKVSDRLRENMMESHG